MYRFPNAKELKAANGEVLSVPDIERDKDGEPVPLKDEEGRILRDSNGVPLAKTKKIIPTLGQWIEYTLNGIPSGKTSMKDSIMWGKVLDKCWKNNGVIQLEDAEHDWLIEAMFSDTQGQFYSGYKADGKNGEDQKAIGALVVQRWGGPRAALIKKAVETKVEDSEVETVEGLLPFRNRAEKRRAGVK